MPRQTPIRRNLVLAVGALAALVSAAVEAQRHHRATLFSEADFRGTSLGYDRDIADLRRSSLGRDNVASLRVARGCRVRLYEGAGFGGHYVEFDGSRRDLDRTAFGADRARALKIRCNWNRSWGDGGLRPTGGRPGRPGVDKPRPRPIPGQGRVTLYSRTNFRGAADGFTRDMVDLGRSRIGNDRAQSVELGRACRVRLYEESGFRGAYVELSGPVADLGRTRLGRNRASSLQLRCDNRPFDDAPDDPGYPDRPGHGDPPGRSLTLYAEIDFYGDYESFGGDVASLSGSAIGNDRASSVRLPRGCRARLYEHKDFRGRYAELARDVADLGYTEVGNNRVTSLKVRCGDRPDWGDSGGVVSYRGVTLYRDSDFRGSSETFRHDMPHLGNSYVGNDTASSVEVERGCRVRLFADIEFEGAYIELDHPEADLRGTRLGNDRVSSLQVRCGRDGDWGDGGYRRPPATLYRDRDFYGDSEAFYEDVPDLRQTRLGNDAAASIEVARGCRVRLYEDAGYRGDSVELNGDVDDLDRTPVGNRRVSSIRIWCR